MNKSEKARIDQLIQHTMRIARGDYEDSLVLSDRNDEMDALTIAVKMMTDDIKAAIGEITDLQEKVHRLKKMEALGLLAGGVAHDLNNVLSGLVSYPDLLLLKLSTDSPLYKPLRTIKESGSDNDWIKAGTARSSPCAKAPATWSRAPRLANPAARLSSAAVSRCSRASPARASTPPCN